MPAAGVRISLSAMGFRTHRGSRDMAAPDSLSRMNQLIAGIAPILDIEQPARAGCRLAVKSETFCPQ